MTPGPSQSSGTSLADGTSAATSAASQLAGGPSLSAGVLRLLAGRAVALVLNFVAWALIARALEPADFGLLQFAISVVFYVSFITDFGITTLGARELAGQRDPRRLVGQLLGLRLALAVVAVAAGAVGVLIASRGVSVWIWLTLLSTVVASAVNAIWILRAMARSTALAVVDASSSVALLIGAVVVWFSFRDPIAAAIAYSGAQWLAAGASVIGIGAVALLRPSLQNAAHHLRTALPLGVAVLAVNVYYSADTVLLGLLRTDAEVGYYAAAYKLVLPWLLIASIVGHLAMPTLARLLVDEPANVIASLRRLSTALTVFGASVAVGVAMVAPLLVVTIFGESFAPAAVPLAILIWSSVTVFANAPFGFLMLARRQDRAYMWTAVAGAVVNLILNALLIPIHGIIGAAIATLVAEVSVLSLIVWFTRDVSVPIIGRSAALAVAIAVVVAVGMWPFVSSFVAIPVGMAIFVAGVLVARITSVSQLRDVARLAASRR